MVLILRRGARDFVRCANRVESGEFSRPLAAEWRVGMVSDHSETRLKTVNFLLSPFASRRFGAVKTGPDKKQKIYRCRLARCRRRYYNDAITAGDRVN